MANNRTRRRNTWANRKLELAIYIGAGILIVSLIVGIGLWFKNLSSDHSPTGNASSQISSYTVTGSFPESEPASQAMTTPVESSRLSSQGTNSSNSTHSSHSVSSSSAPSRSELAEDLDNWNLIIANLDTKLSKDWAPPSTKSIGNEQTIDSRIYDAYTDLVQAAKRDGVTLKPVSGYRSYEKQTRLYQNRVDRSQKENPDFTRIEAENDAALYVARPGTSEHQTGLSIDFNSVEVDFEDTTAGKWLRKHAAEYGFVLRYDKDKTDITKISYEPWHYRYVGVEHAKKMNELDYCLEEYLEYLKGE